ncbi:arsenic transporter [Burkholderia glumae]|uniref:Arsenic transporter n=1 Tax=Burkholderia glumae TaxID=337 RepID=A0AAQ0BRF9_BURGL|nr:arsenic transporter [Burkholderia glumae]ACR32026.1 Arsenical pump membrane protein [Burkholderia glumae BGR1]AJY63221.1 citrate transporter family protein [Burkholderia glumae LMG 2196 = ATCC 33617]KHJ60780.1 arsenic transporter [Burkholderia glumae]MCM2484797.1 arsenic transporter [Burkholderia glumae]MCM2495179.1 arsenic transporter [Burkholderia glumae]
MNPTFLAWGIALAATAGVILRPFRWPEAIWAVLGALMLVVLGLLPAKLAWQAVGKGTDVYLFLIGMMLLSELGRSEGLFDWVAVHAVNLARGSPRRLFLLVYLVGVVVTTFLSNDAAAVVLTPAVFAAARKAQTKALPLVYVCAFIANAASFVLPISNPANLVLYANHTPALGSWVARFALPSVLAIVATFLMLRWTQRASLGGACARDLPVEALGANGKLTLASIGVTAVALLVVSAFDLPLGLPTAVLGMLTALVVLIKKRQSPLELVGEISWSVLPLVAGLFVLVEMLDHTGVIRELSGWLEQATRQNASITAASAGLVIAFGSNAINNLPAGLIASATALQAHAPERVIDALLIGVDLGPNLSITGSLATILWLSAIRREGEEVSFGQFLKVGGLVMLPALALALASRLLIGH